MRYISNIYVCIRYTMLWFHLVTLFILSLKRADILTHHHMAQCQERKNIRSNGIQLLSLPLPKVLFHIYARFVTKKVYHKNEKKFLSATRVSSQ